MRELDYEASAAARPVVVEHDGGVTRVVVLMPGPYGLVPTWAHELDLLSLVVVPIWWLAAWLVRRGLRRPTPPRAIFTISADRFRMALRDPGSGAVTTFDWPRGAVCAVRSNRYERGLWVNVTGHVRESYLADLPRETIERLERVLAMALNGDGI